MADEASKSKAIEDFGKKADELKVKGLFALIDGTEMKWRYSGMNLGEALDRANDLRAALIKKISEGV